MTSTDVRGDPSLVDAEWMTDALEESGVARGARVLDVELMRFVGNGQMGRNARFALSWDHPGRPTTVIAKFPADDLTARATGFDNGGYRREWVFYTELRPTVGIRTPEVWVARFDETAGDFVLVMEDLADSVPGDQINGLSVDQAALALEQAVALHAPRWGDDTLAGVLGDRRQDGARFQGFYEGTVDGTIERLGDGLDDDAVELLRDLTPFVARWRTGTDTPSTMVHMDYRPDNMMFAATASAPPLVVVDWQTTGFGLAANDVAYMIGGAFEPATRGAVERGLVDEYRSRLQAAGVRYDADAFERDYRRGSLWGVLIGVFAAMRAEQTERGDELFTTMLRRHARHAIDLEALDLLR